MSPSSTCGEGAYCADDDDTYAAAQCLVQEHFTCELDPPPQFAYLNRLPPLSDRDRYRLGELVPARDCWASKGVRDKDTHCELFELHEPACALVCTAGTPIRHTTFHGQEVDGICGKSPILRVMTMSPESELEWSVQSDVDYANLGGSSWGHLMHSLGHDTRNPYPSFVAGCNKLGHVFDVEH